MSEPELNQEIFNKDFMANFTHQLIGPLQSIQANCENIADGIVDKNNIENTLRLVVAQTRECIDLVRNMAMIASILSSDERGTGRRFAWLRLGQDID